MAEDAQESLRAAEDAVRAGADDVALLHLWNALEQARVFGDREALVGVRTFARTLALRNDEAARVVDAAERALEPGGLFPVPTEAVVSRPARPEGADAAEGESTEESESAEAEDQQRPPSRAFRVLFVLFVVLLLGVNVAVRAWLDDRGARPFEPPAIEVVPEGQGHRGRYPVVAEGLFIVPLDATPDALVAESARAVAARYPISAGVLGRIRSERQTLDDERDQLEGDALIAELFRAYPTRNRRSVIIGVTNYDLYWAGASADRFAFGVRAEDRYAVLSTARMDVSNYGGAADRQLLRQRLEKMILRYVGDLYFQLPRVANERSVLRDSIRSLSDLDEMTFAFCPDQPRAPSGC